jgi:heme exporter protein B
MLLSLLIIPLYVPVLVFGVGAVEEAARGYDASAWLALMGAFALGGLVLAPLAISAGLRISLDS